MICVAFKNFRFICIFKYFILFWDSVSSDIAQAQVWPQTPNPPSPSTICIFEMTGKHHCDWLALLLLGWVVYLSTLMPREHPSLNSCPRAGVLPFWLMIVTQCTKLILSFQPMCVLCLLHSQDCKWGQREEERLPQKLKTSRAGKRNSTWLIICSAGTWKTDETAWVGSLVRPGQPGCVVRHCLHKQSGSVQWGHYVFSPLFVCANSSHLLFSSRRNRSHSGACVLSVPLDNSSGSPVLF